jgi:hypothetical protein
MMHWALDGDHLAFGALARRWPILDLVAAHSKIDEVVSTDFLHDARSSIFNAGSGIELNSRFSS